MSEKARKKSSDAETARWSSNDTPYFLIFQSKSDNFEKNLINNN
jgi:hypothetical protein